MLRHMGLWYMGKLNTCTSNREGYNVIRWLLVHGIACDVARLGLVLYTFRRFGGFKLQPKAKVRVVSELTAVHQPTELPLQHAAMHAWVTSQQDSQARLVHPSDTRHRRPVWLLQAGCARSAVHKISAARQSPDSWSRWLSCGAAALPGRCTGGSAHDVGWTTRLPRGARPALPHSECQRLAWALFIFGHHLWM